MISRKALKISFISLVVILGLLLLTSVLIMKQAQFGKAPDKNRIELYSQLSNFENGKFQNQIPTSNFVEGFNFWDILYRQLFKKANNTTPAVKIPSIKSDLLNLDPDKNIMVWFGHSSYFMQIDGKKILVDPVFSNNASPIRGTNKAFEGTNVYQVSDLPEIDFLFITHDHYDHLDYKSVMALNPKVKKIICGLGVGSHFEHWGFDMNKIEEKNWYEKVELGDDFSVYLEPTRHFSGRSIFRNNTLWTAYLLQTPSMKIYIGGDSGYAQHFSETGKKFGEIDLAILENGQSDEAWSHIHMLPDEVLQAGQDLNAKRIFPVHSAKFNMANHAWDEPLSEITRLNQSLNLSLLTPMIGEIVDLNNENLDFKNWWENLEDY